MNFAALSLLHNYLKEGHELLMVVDQSGWGTSRPGHTMWGAKAARTSTAESLDYNYIYII